MISRTTGCIITVVKAKKNKAKMSTRGGFDTYHKQYGEKKITGNITADMIQQLPKGRRVRMTWYVARD